MNATSADHYQLSVGAAIFTYNACHHLNSCLKHVSKSSLKPRILVVDSTSNDGTIEKAQNMGAETLVIPREEFNHGATREMARKYLNTDIVVMMTQDAYPKSSDFLQYLVAPFLDSKASVSYARQIPHNGAGFFEAFPRNFNYPGKSYIRGIEDIDRYGASIFFCSNSCAAWSNAALDEIGGFSPILANEDTFAVAKLLNKGHRIAYVSEAVVYHSHSYSLLQEFRRYFDTGFTRKLYRENLFYGHGDKKNGSRYVSSMLKQLIKQKPLAIPYAILHIAVKFFGYQAGNIGTRLPPELARFLSAQDYYWSSIYNTHRK